MFPVFFFFYPAKGFEVKDVVEGIEYEFHLSAINASGASEFGAPSEFVFARDPKRMWTFAISFSSLAVFHAADTLRDLCCRASW